MDELYGFAAVPVIVALVEAIKRLGGIDDGNGAWSRRVSPALAIVVAVAWNAGLAAYQDDRIVPAVFVGIVMGLAASGLYSSAKAAAGK